MNAGNGNEFREFQERFGDYTNYDMNEEEILDKFHDAYREGEELEELLLVEDPNEFEEDVFDYFAHRDQGWLSGIADSIPHIDDRIDEESYLEFIQDFEIEPAEEDMLYWCRYDPD